MIGRYNKKNKLNPNMPRKIKAIMLCGFRSGWLARSIYAFVVVCF